MGMLEWKGGTPFYLLTSLLIPLILANDGDGSCNAQPCWEEYQKANTYYQADVPGVSNQQARKCTVLRTYRACLDEMNSAVCAGSLDYQGTKRVLRAKFRTSNCTDDGPVYPEGPEPVYVTPTTPCKFKGEPVYTYCALFGDPHLVTFSGEQVTCKIEGAWPLIDNEFFTVQVTNSPLSVSTRAATVTQKVTVVVKASGSGSHSGAFCGSREPVFYSAETGSLPSSFSDGMKEYGAYGSIQVNTVTPGEQVEIYLRYIDSTVIIRQINGEYFSVGIRMPEKVLNGTINNPDIHSLRQLCVDSCPAVERVSIGEVLANVSVGTSSQKLSYATAQQMCTDKSVADFFLDSCVFDLYMTGEPLFSDMASSAYEDVKRYASRQPRWSNRTRVQQSTSPMTGYQQPPGMTVPSIAAVCSLSRTLVRTLLFVYIMHITSLLVLL